MGAVPNRLIPPDKSVSTRKTPSRAREPKETRSCKPREWQELDRSIRAGTSYEKVSGWAPLFGAFIADMLRLASGATCWALVSLILHDLGRQRTANGALPEESRPLAVPELASLCQVDERSINRELQYLAARGMATIARLAGGKVVVRLMFRDWPQIEQSYRDWAAERAAEAPVDEPEETPATDEPLAVKKGTVQLTKSPQVVKAGHRSRSIPVGCGVRSLRVHWENKVFDLSFQAVVMSGELVLTGSVPEKKTLESKNSAKVKDSSTYEYSSGHICPQTSRKGGADCNQSSGGAPGAARNTPPFTHPRAAELSGIFDAVLYHHIQKTLSGDSRSLASACNAIGDTPHDVILAAVKERSSRPIKRTSDCIAICKEIEHNWRVSKDFPELERVRIPTREEVMAMAEADRVALAEKKASLRRKGKL